MHSDPIVVTALNFLHLPVVAVDLPVPFVFQHHCRQPLRFGQKIIKNADKGYVVMVQNNENSFDSQIEIAFGPCAVAEYVPDPRHSFFSIYEWLGTQK